MLLVPLYLVSLMDIRIDAGNKHVKKKFMQLYSYNCCNTKRTVYSNSILAKFIHWPNLQIGE